MPSSVKSKDGIRRIRWVGSLGSLEIPVCLKKSPLPLVRYGLRYVASFSVCDPHMGKPIGLVSAPCLRCLPDTDGVVGKNRLCKGLQGSKIVPLIPLMKSLKGCLNPQTDYWLLNFDEFSVWTHFVALMLLPSRNGCCCCFLRLSLRFWFPLTWNCEATAFFCCPFLHLRHHCDQRSAWMKLAGGNENASV